MLYNLIKGFKMTKNNIISSTLLASALTLSSIAVSSLSANQQIKRDKVSSKIASLLHERGLDRDAAHSISNKFIDDEELFEKRINNLVDGCSILNRDEILNYLSKAALHKRTVQLDSYQYLVGMVYDIKQKPLNKKILTELKNISSLNI